jgi:hypothetical protein
MAATIYLLCAITALLCSVLLLRGYRRSRVPLLFWSGLCFAMFAVDNSLLFLDRIILPTVDLSLLRMFPGPIGICLLLYGLIWKSK